MTKRQFSPITMFLLALVVMLSVFLFRNEVSSQNVEAEPSSQTTSRAPSGIYFTYQGQLLDSNNQPINAALPITFRLYKTLTGGTNCWSETHSGGNAIAIADGVFSVTLGKRMPIADSCVTDDIYLELVVNGETLSPREQLTSFANTLPDSATLRGSVSATSVHATIIEISNGAVPLIFNEVGSSGPGSKWRMPLDGRMLRFDASQNGNDFSSYITPLTMHANGDVSVHRDLEVSGTLNTRGIVMADDHDIVGTDRIVGFNDLRFYGDAGDSPSSPDMEIRQNGDVVVRTNLSIGNSCTVGDSLSGSEVVDDPTCGQLSALSIQTGAFVEANLQTQEEMRSTQIERFELGDVLCWSTQSERLELCDVADDRLVMAVADRNGKPIVMGAEPTKVIGSVQAGDILVSSDTPGYAIVNNNPAPGTVIGQALEDFNGDSGIIKAMIRKW